VVIAVPLVLGLPAPFHPVHIVILELFMDIGASVAFVSEPPVGSSKTNRFDAMRLAQPN